MSDELEGKESGNTASAHNHCKRCGRGIKGNQEYGPVCAKKVKAEAELKKDETQQEQK